MYLDDQLWSVLHSRAKSRKTTISQLVREAVRERYIGSLEERTKAMQEFVGTRKDRPGAMDAVELVRGLRRGSRLDRLHE